MSVNLAIVDPAHMPASFPQSGTMEAHEHLGNMLDLDCCSRIQIAIRNADHYPETVSLELVLINASAPGKPSQSLGTMMVKSTHPGNSTTNQPSPSARR